MSNYYLIIIYQKFRAFIPNRYNLKAGAFVSCLLKMPKLWENRMNYVHKTEDKEEFDMCKAMRELLEEERKNGLSQGIVQGVTQGRSSGKVEGAKNKTMTVIQNMLERGFSDEDICAIAECDLNMIEEVRGRFK
jgi:hypothetical protein